MASDSFRHPFVPAGADAQQLGPESSSDEAGNACGQEMPIMSLISIA
jgi:hypothetical protein